MPASPQVTEMWSRRTRTKSRDGSGDTGVRVWQVAGAVSEADAFSLATEAGIGQQWPDDPSLTVESVAASRPGFALYELTANYAVKPPPDDSGGADSGGAGAGADGGASGGGIPIEFNFSAGTEGVAIDTDYVGDPIKCSAGDSVDPPPQDVACSFFYSVTMREPNYEANIAAEYCNAIMEDEVATPYGSFKPLECLCTGIVPAQPILHRQRFAIVQYNLAIRLLSQWPNIPTNISPFDIRILDQGLNGWATIGGVVQQQPFYWKKGGGAVGFPIRLDGEGKPFRADLFAVGPTLADPIATPAADRARPSAVQKAKDGVYLWYRRKLRQPFSKLNLPTE